MKTIKHEKFTEIVADEGKWLTQKNENESRVYTDSVCLGVNDSEQNWREADNEEKEEWEKEQEAQMEAAMNAEMQEGAIEADGAIEA